MPNDNMSTLDKISAVNTLLDNLVEASGRKKAGYICFASDFLNKIRDDVLILEEKLKDKDKTNQNGTETQE